MPPTNGRKELVAANVFGVRIPGMELGYFVECRGLAVEVEVQEYAEGGNNQFVHQLPGRLIYPKLELARGMTTEDNLLKWFMQTRVALFRAAFAGSGQRRSQPVSGLAVGHPGGLALTPASTARRSPRGRGMGVRLCVRLHDDRGVGAGWSRVADIPSRRTPRA